MTEEKVARTIVIDETEGVKLNPFAAREAVHHGKFIDGIFERKYGLIRSEAIAAKDDVAAFERWIEPRSLVRRNAKSWAGKIELGAGRTGEGGPETARNKGRRSGGQFEIVGPRDVDFEIAGGLVVIRDHERVMFFVERDGHAAFTPQTHGEAADFEREAVGLGGGGMRVGN